MEEIDATTARRQLRPILDRARRGEATAITRFGEVIAFIVPVDWVETTDAGDEPAEVIAAYNGPALVRDE